VAPLLLVLAVAGVIAVGCWILSLITRDTSQVDRMWSIAPPIYLWIFAGGAGFVDARLTLMAVLATLWGARLTFNFARKGGYSGVEDYRWAVLRKAMSAGQFQLFNLFFIVIYQNALLVMIALPGWTALEHGAPLGPVDGVLAVLFVGALVGETVADQQQWAFHRRKRRGAPDPAVSEGFLREGLFRYSRHPNYFFEISMWWLIFGFGAVAAGSLLQGSIAGAALLTVLFVGSTIMTERISSSKYPRYADYQARTSPIVPWPPRTSPRKLAVPSSSPR
jgi:steroid 5-alpha reductase family enzyme